MDDRSHRSPAWAPWPYGWNIVAVALLIQILAYGTIVSSLSLFISIWSAEFDVPKSVIASFQTANSAIGALAAIFIGPLFDRYPTRKLVLGGLVLYAAGYVMIFFSKSIYIVAISNTCLLSVALFLMGLVPSQILATRWFPERSGPAIGITATGMTLGGVIMPPITAYMMASGLSWRATCGIFALVVVGIVIPIVALVLRERPPAPAVSVMAGPNEVAALTAPPKLRLWTNPVYLCATLTALCLWLTYATFQANLGPLVLSFGGSLTDAGMFIAMLNFAGICGALVIGMLTDRLPHRYIFCMAAAITALGLIGFANTTSFAAQMMAAALIGFGTGGTGANLASFFMYRFGAGLMGASMGLASAFSRLSALGPPLFAFAREATGSYTLSWTCLIATVGVALVMGWFLPVARAADVDEPDKSARTAPA